MKLQPAENADDSASARPSPDLPGRFHDRVVAERVCCMRRLVGGITLHSKGRAPSSEFDIGMLDAPQSARRTVSPQSRRNL